MVTGFGGGGGLPMAGELNPFMMVLALVIIVVVLILLIRSFEF